MRLFFSPFHTRRARKIWPKLVFLGNRLSQKMCKKSGLFGLFGDTRGIAFPKIMCVSSLQRPLCVGYSKCYKKTPSPPGYVQI